MLPTESEFFKEYVAFLILVAHDYLVVLEESALLHLGLLGEWETLRGEDDLVEVIDCDLVVRVEYEAVLRTEVPGDPEL